MSRLAKLVASTALIVGGFVVGLAVDDDPPIEAPGPARVVQVPKYIERTTTVEKTYIPDACLKSVKASQDLSEAVNLYESQVGKLPRILDDAYLAIHNQSLSDINKLKSRQQDAESGSMAALLDLHNKMKASTLAEKRCQQELGR